MQLLQEKMQEYIENGTQLGWLIDRKQRKVFIDHPGNVIEELALLNQDMNLQFTGMTRRSRDVAMLRLYVWSMIWHRTTKMYAHIIHDQIQQRRN
ncbi:hypothetical protein NIES592_04020 [Fischerella major NIES-592]|uniref:Putative restriction endonuclease domain-containing protein n=1 Tax=Fischerella major NIES-592 TaxID=210994 RepID=A0A1U7H2D7_9CYAN|nr:hypothetical protein NIES592_04020 [Fischerella major NIES-592]